METISEKERLHSMQRYENKLINEGYSWVAGVDEVGRGPLAGPVVACCVIYNEALLISGINDSKLLTPLKRKKVYEQLLQQKSQFALGIVSSEEIDRINILQATFLAMKKAITKLSGIDYLLVDGNQLPKLLIPSKGVIQGDRQSICIAAASIIAKETRDNLMLEYHKKYPEYSFDSHKGYGTKKHKEALLKYGPCPIHRKSFRPVAEAIVSQTL